MATEERANLELEAKIKLSELEEEDIRYEMAAG